MTKQNLQDVILQDKSITGRVRPWSERKMQNELLAVAYKSIDFKKSERLKDCAKFVTFQKTASGSSRLVDARFCRVRLCPMCTWRRSLKVYCQVSEIMDKLKEQNFRYVLLTLTVQNVSGEELSETLDSILRSFQRLMALKVVKTAVRGWYRSLEVTHDMNPIITSPMYRARSNYYRARGIRPKDPNPNYNCYHPHLHVILAVPPDYFEHSYISQPQWTALWQKSLRADYRPSVDVRKIKGNTAKAVSEVSKYAVKFQDVVTDDWDLTVDTVRVLDKALHKRRLVAFGGVFKETHAKLSFDDPEDGDLIELKRLKEDDREPLENFSYVWNSGYRQYIRSL